MRVGLTYDLAEDHLRAGMSPEDAAEFDSPVTIAALDTALTELGHLTDRIGDVHALARRLVAGDRWDLVFNIAEGVHGFGREAQIPALMDAFDIPYTFSDPVVLGLCLHKAMTKRVVRDGGVPTPGFAVVDTLADVDRVELAFPVFAKPVAEGSSKGIGGASLARDPAELAAVCSGLLARHSQPVLVERFLPGREFTVGVLGTGRTATAIGALEISPRSSGEQVGYTYANKLHYEERIDLTLATDAVARRAQEIAVAAWRLLGCRDAGRVDLRCDEAGEPQFLEVNPLAGLHPIRSDLPILCRLTGRSYRDLIAAILAGAQARRGPSAEFLR